MFKINKLKLEIISDDFPNIVYGFNYSFRKGLNLVVGENSQGKSTICSCIYYCLGMEELLGKQGSFALDKSLKDSFSVYNEDESIINVTSSDVYLEIENENSIVTLKRSITNRNSIITICESTLGMINSESIWKDYFTNGAGNNDTIAGFYKWLADFFKIELPEVTNTSKTNSRSPLYLQVIFSAFMIEQTRGWSDYFATLPYFGIPKAKNKNIEFLLGLNELALAKEKENIKREKKKLKLKWKDCYDYLKIKEKQQGAVLKNLNKEIVDPEDFTNVCFYFTNSDYQETLLSSYKASLVEKLGSLEVIPKIENVDVETKYNEAKTSYDLLWAKVQEFEKNLSLDKEQLSLLNSQKERLERELKNRKSLRKAFSENIINKDNNTCPTCTQHVSVDLLSSKSINIDVIGLDENVTFLEVQIKMNQKVSQALSTAIKERAHLLKYHKIKLNKNKLLIKALSKDMISDDRAFSEAKIVEKLSLQNEIGNLNLISDDLEKININLRKISKKYKELSDKELTLNDNSDSYKLEILESSFKEKLFDFGYSSNPKWHISINKKEPFKYFPVFTNRELPQSLRINSSASDFVRALWAYYIALLEVGENHPGVLLFDEPGQHRMSVESLRNLFEYCSNLEDRQILIFSSINKIINKGETLELEKLIENLEDENFNLIELDKKQKVITELYCTLREG